VKGVRLSGVFPVKNGELQPATIRVYGAEASPGTIRFGSGKRLTGTLGGRRFNLSLARIKLSRASGGGEWPSHPVAFPLAGLVEQRPPQLR
jgi:hypothetical protein